MTREQISYFDFQGHSVFLPLRFLYAECLVLIDGSPQLYPLACFNRPCPVMKNCPDVLAHRVNYLFDKIVPNAEVIYAYFKHPDRPRSIRAGMFRRDLSEPKTIVMNLAAFNKFRREGVTYNWIPPDEFIFMGGSDSQIIPATNLLIKRSDV